MTCELEFTAFLLLVGLLFIIFLSILVAIMFFCNTKRGSDSEVSQKATRKPEDFDFDFDGDFDDQTINEDGANDELNGLLTNATCFSPLQNTNSSSPRQVGNRNSQSRQHQQSIEELARTMPFVDMQLIERVIRAKLADMPPSYLQALLFSRSLEECAVEREEDLVVVAEDSNDDSNQSNQCFENDDQQNSQTTTNETETSPPPPGYEQYCSESRMAESEAHTEDDDDEEDTDDTDEENETFIECTD